VVLLLVWAAWCEGKNISARSGTRIEIVRCCGKSKCLKTADLKTRPFGQSTNSTGIKRQSTAKAQQSITSTVSKLITLQPTLTSLDPTTETIGSKFENAICLNNNFCSFYDISQFNNSSS